eukprot:m.147520 g.147520  ORF g.147520 m.147520 type:complete len:621 (+) comp10104_c1_seq8:2715-4577(+)
MLGHSVLGAKKLGNVAAVHLGKGQAVGRHPALLRNSNRKVFKSLSFLKRNVVRDNARDVRKGDKHLAAQLLRRQRQREVHKWIKCDGNLVALGANKRRAVLPVEEIGDDRAVARKMSLPSLLGDFVVRPLSCCDRLDKGLFEDAIQILVNAVEKKRKKLLRVMLLVATKLRRKLGDEVLEFAWNNHTLVARPNAFQEMRKFLGKAASAANRVARVNFALVLAADEKLLECNSIAQALQGRVHEASVADVAKPSQPGRVKWRGGPDGRWNTVAEVAALVAKRKVRLVSANAVETGSAVAVAAAAVAGGAANSRGRCTRHGSGRRGRLRHNWLPLARDVLVLNGNDLVLTNGIGVERGKASGQGLNVLVILVHRKSDIVVVGNAKRTGTQLMQLIESREARHRNGLLLSFVHNGKSKWVHLRHATNAVGLGDAADLVVRAGHAEPPNKKIPGLGRQKDIIHILGESGAELVLHVKERRVVNGAGKALFGAAALLPVAVPLGRDGKADPQHRSCPQGCTAPIHSLCCLCWHTAALLLLAPAAPHLGQVDFHLLAGRHCADASPNVCADLLRAPPPSYHLTLPPSPRTLALTTPQVIHAPWKQLPALSGSQLARSRQPARVLSP